MSKKRDLIKVGLAYKYAPESLYILLIQKNGTYKKLNADTSRYMWGYWLAIGEKEKALAEIKRVLRSRERSKKRLVTYGYYVKGSLTRYAYINGSMLLADEYNIAEKLSVYKENRRYWLKCGGKHYAGNTAKLNGNYQLENVKREYEEIDFARAAKIYVQHKIDERIPIVL